MHQFGAGRGQEAPAGAPDTFLLSQEVSLVVTSQRRNRASWQQVEMPRHMRAWVWSGQGRLPGRGTFSQTSSSLPAVSPDGPRRRQPVEAGMDGPAYVGWRFSPQSHLPLPSLPALLPAVLTGAMCQPTAKGPAMSPGWGRLSPASHFTV